MKQIIVLEQNDIKAMLKGNLVHVHIGTETIMLGCERVRKQYSKSTKPKQTFKCHICRRMFETPTGLGSHKKSKHGIQGVTTHPQPKKTKSNNHQNRRAA